MIGTEESKPLPLPYRTVEICKEFGQLLVEPDILFVGQFMVGAILMAVMSGQEKLTQIMSASSR